MYRVAAVAATLFDALKEKNPELEGKHELIVACLLHDMGNIIKFNFDLMPAPDGNNEYWKGVQKEFSERFGNDELRAAELIMAELGVLSAVAPILEHTSFPYGEELLRSGTLLQKIAGYADQRVGPTGVLSLVERLEYVHRRYSERGSVYGDTQDPKIQALNKAIQDIEKELFAGLSIDPEDINDRSIAICMKDLASFEI